MGVGDVPQWQMSVCAHTISLNTGRKLKIEAQFVQIQSPLSRRVMFHNGKALFAKQEASYCAHGWLKSL